MGGLRARLTRSFLLVAVTVVTVTAGLILLTGSRLFSNYLLSSQTLRQQRIIWTLEQTYAAYDSWDGLAGGGGFMGMMAGSPFIVRDRSGRVIVDTGAGMAATAPGRSLGPGFGPQRGMMMQMGRGPMMGAGPWSDQASLPPPEEWRKPLRKTAHATVYALEDAGRQIGTVTFARPRSERIVSSLEGTFRWLVFLAALVAAILAAVIGWGSGRWLARRLSQPILALHDATRRFGAGELGTRVVIPAHPGAVAPAEIAELTDSFNVMAERLEKLEKMRRQLTADVAHELRTPVAAAHNLVEAFQDGVLPPDRENLASLERELERLGRIVADLRDLSVAESGTLQLARERLDLREVLDEVLETWRPRFAAAGLIFSAVLPETSVPVVGDSSALARIFVNLLSNAQKYTRQGGRIDVTLAREGCQGIVRVTDTGIGIPAAELPLVYERFYRGEAARRAGVEGIGVGLAIVREIVRAHGGEIQLDSRPNSGTTVTVRFPCA